jgi:multidrug efflux pump subunit AcrA (membrane-fusion protein)
MAKAPHAVTVPLTAVFMDEKKSFAYVKKGDDFEKREIEPGIGDGMIVEIRKGLAAGDEVALEKPPEKPAAK